MFVSSSKKIKATVGQSVRTFGEADIFVEKTEGESKIDCVSSFVSSRLQLFRKKGSAFFKAIPSLGRGQTRRSCIVVSIALRPPSLDTVTFSRVFQKKNMAKLTSLDKVKETLVRLKESIDTAEEREIEANQLKQEADSRLEKAEEESESYRRRYKLLQADLVKTKKALEEKQKRLDHVEGRSLDDDEKRREFEGVEVERDDQLIAIEEEALAAKQEAAESTHILMETQRKLQVVEGDMDKVHQRLDAADAKEKACIDTIERNSDEMRSLEDRDNDAAEREIEAEEKLRFLEDQLKEAVVRAENAERDVVRNENIVASVRNDLLAIQTKHNDIGSECDRIDDLVLSLNCDEPALPVEPQVEE